MKNTSDGSMPPKTLKALRGSIKKWEGVHAGKMADKGTENCHLCKLFCSNPNNAYSCDGCPVYELTNDIQCRSTPYFTSWRKSGGGYGMKATTKILKLAALDEVNFLKSLLPPTERKHD